MDISTSFPLMKHTHSYTFSATTQNPVRSNYSVLFIISSNGIAHPVKAAARTNTSPIESKLQPQNERRRSASLHEGQRFLMTNYRFPWEEVQNIVHGLYPF